MISKTGSNNWIWMKSRPLRSMRQELSVGGSFSLSCLFASELTLHCSCDHFVLQIPLLKLSDHDCYIPRCFVLWSLWSSESWSHGGHQTHPWWWRARHPLVHAWPLWLWAVVDWTGRGWSWQCCHYARSFLDRSRAVCWYSVCGTKCRPPTPTDTLVYYWYFPILHTDDIQITIIDKKLYLTIKDMPFNQNCAKMGNFYWYAHKNYWYPPKNAAYTNYWHFAIGQWEACHSKMMPSLLSFLRRNLCKWFHISPIYTHSSICHCNTAKTLKLQQKTLNTQLLKTSLKSYLGCFTFNVKLVVIIQLFTPSC